MTRLPRGLEDLRGLRAARWIRESTAGQVDRFGPDAQREQQDQAIARHELEDTGIAWLVAHSGRTIASTPAFAEMLAGAGTAYDVLVVGYVSRFARDLETAVTARSALHRAGAAILFADERVLSSDEDSWETWAREALEAEAYSRRLGRRIREGYAAKRRRLADPGGNAPYGFRRTGPDRTLEPDPELAGEVQRIFELAAASATDRDVALQSGLPLPTVRGILRNPIYAGRLADGTPTRFAAPIDAELWQRATLERDRRRRNRGRRPVRTPYALSMLHCQACGRRLVGDNRRYRHVELCPAFAAAVATGRKRRPGQHRAPLGASYPAEAYEAAVGAVLRRVAVGADVAVNVIASFGEDQREPDRLALARIDRERQAAASRFVRDRDQARLSSSMARLDAEEAAAREIPPRPPLDAAAAAEYLRDLERLWADAPSSRRRLAEALFERIEVLGLRRIRVTPTPEAIATGLAEAFTASAGGWSEPGRSRARSNRLLVRLVPGVTTSIEVVAPDRVLRVVEAAS